jgi:hypothetical protein
MDITCSNLVAMIHKIYLFVYLTMRIIALNKKSKLTRKYFSQVQMKKELFLQILQLFS